MLDPSTATNQLTTHRNLVRLGLRQTRGASDGVEVSPRRAYWLIAGPCLVVAGILTLVNRSVFDEISSLHVAAYVALLPTALVLLMAAIVKMYENGPSHSPKLGKWLFAVSLVVVLIRFGDEFIVGKYDNPLQYYTVLSAIFIIASSMLYGLLPNRSELVSSKKGVADLPILWVLGTMMLSTAIYMSLNQVSYDPEKDIPWWFIILMITAVVLVLIFVSVMKKAGWFDLGLLLYFIMAMILSMHSSRIFNEFSFILLNVNPWVYLMRDTLVGGIIDLVLAIAILYCIASWMLGGIGVLQKEEAQLNANA